MRREEIIEGVERLGPWFHCIDLGAGLVTKTVTAVGEPVEHPRPTWERVRPHLPDDLTGKTVLDVGCNAGFYCVEAKRRGARRVLGIDAQRSLVRQAQFVRRVLGLDIEYRRESVYDLDPNVAGQFDVTLALGLVYHLKHLVLALEKLFQVTRELLIVETAVFPPGRSPGSFAHPVGGLRPTLHPLAYVENPQGSKEAIYNWFLPSPDALRALLLNTGFDEVTVHPGEYEERAVLVCRKRAPYPDSRSLQYLSALITLPDDAPIDARAGGEIRFRARVENTGFARWLAAGEGDDSRGAVRLAAHLTGGARDDDGADEGETFFYYAGAVLPRDVEPGESVELDLVMRAPDRPGRYVLEFDMVSEHLSWFEDLGSHVPRRELRVT
ncbi:MAG TPA: DUF1698 domain-containing protein [Pyrinomonadaceae bacterium]|nr:DUF1698 domain-containing protein [Pyrinomonadaceae bacterium]